MICGNYRGRLDHLDVLTLKRGEIMNGIYVRHLVEHKGNNRASRREKEAATKHVMGGSKHAMGRQKPRGWRRQRRDARKRVKASRRRNR